MNQYKVILTPQAGELLQGHDLHVQGGIAAMVTAEQLTTEGGSLFFWGGNAVLPGPNGYCTTAITGAQLQVAYAAGTWTHVEIVR